MAEPDEGFAEFTASLDTPMFVVTTAAGGERSGCLVGFASQTSIDPPRFLAGLSVRNHTYRVARGARVLAVHALGRDQRGLAELFGAETGDDVDKFARCEWEEGPDGVPVLAGCAYLVGRIVERVPLGDHVGHLLAPVSGRGAPGPLLRLSDVADLPPGHEA